MRITFKPYFPILTATALLLAASASAQTVYDFVPTLSPPSPDFAATITVNAADFITAVTFSDGTGSPQTTIPLTSLPEPVVVVGPELSGFSPILLSGELYLEGIFITDTGINYQYLDGPQEASADIAGSFIQVPSTSAPDRMSTWAVLISTVGGLIFFQRRAISTARA
jgi:hypothetical protein